MWREREVWGPVPIVLRKITVAKDCCERSRVKKSAAPTRCRSASPRLRRCSNSLPLSTANIRRMILQLRKISSIFEYILVTPTCSRLRNPPWDIQKDFFSYSTLAGSLHYTIRSGFGYETLHYHTNSTSKINIDVQKNSTLPKKCRGKYIYRNWISYQHFISAIQWIFNIGC